MSHLTASQAAPAIPQGDFLSRTRVVKNPILQKLCRFLMVFGPGLIVMMADNDAGAVSTYTEAGARYGLRLMWLLILLLPVTYFCQEMVVRLGIATGEGHAAMIYQRFGKWWGRFSLFDLQLVNFLTIVTEFAAINLAFSAFGVSPFISVPLAAGGLIWMVLTGSYLRWERVTILLCLLNVTWLALAWKSGFHGAEVASAVFRPRLPQGGFSAEYLFIMIAIVGTTVAPWQLFFQQSCIADKRLKREHLNMARMDTLIGAVAVVVLAGGMMLVGDHLFRHGLPYEDPAQMAGLLGLHLGSFVRCGLLLLQVNAAILGATAISLSSAWAYAEVKGWDHSLEKRFKDAPAFYATYILAILAAAAIVLIPRAPLQLIILGVQVLAGLMLPSAIVFLQILLNDVELLGKEWVNKTWNNLINWVIVALLFGLSVVLAVQVLLPSRAASLLH